jgi:hypothetical protein
VFSVPLGANALARLLADLYADLYLSGRPLEATDPLQPSTWIELNLTAKGRATIA